MASGSDRRPLTTPLLLLFAASGAAALIYEVVWFHLLRLVVGATSVSLGIVLASFMGGLLLGSLLFHRLVSPARHPLRVYALLELLIAASGLLLPALLPQVTHVYASFAGYGYGNVLFRGLLCALCLLPPTVMMGATLPAIARWMASTRVGVASVGLFYTANVVGGVAGTLLAGFVLLRHYDVIVASACAIVANLAAACIALALADRAGDVSTGALAAPDPEPEPAASLSPAAVHAAVALSGLTALGAQVVWTRLLSLLLGATTYSFSIILAVFLSGLCIGSGVGARAARTLRRPGIALAATQLALVAAIPWSAYAIAGLLPQLHFVAFETPWWAHRVDDLLRCAVAILPATIAWGAAFPLALACAGVGARDLSHVVGRLYAANTLGAIAGALAFSLAMIPAIGTRASQQLLTALAAAAALAVIAGLAYAAPRRVGRAAGAAILVVALGVLLAGRVPPIPTGMVTYGRATASWDYENDVLLHREGRNASVAVTQERGNHRRNLHVSGKVVASTYPGDMRLQRMLGHLPAMLHERPRSVLVVGFGTGITAGVFALYPTVERITIVEIEPEVSALAGPFFEAENYGVLDDPRTRLVIDDARHFIATTEETFDVITSDPIHPWVKGAAALYTEEYFELCRRRLNRGGVIAQWVPFYETSEAAVKSEIAAFLRAFPHGSIWNTLGPGAGYDVTLLGRLEPGSISADQIQRRLDALPSIASSLARVKIHSALDLLRSYAGRRDDLSRWLSDAERNLDRNLRLEYLAGEAVDLQLGDEIYAEMARHLSYPEELFALSREQENALRESFARHRR